jgi:hypothetical protein
VKSDVDFYDHNNTCPTCRQAFSEGFKAEFVEDSKKKIDEYKAGIKKIKKEIEKCVSLIASAAAETPAVLGPGSSSRYGPN